MPGEVERWSMVQAWLYGLCWSDPRSNREMIRLVGPRAGMRALDIGPGPGAAVRRAAQAGADAVGVEPSSAMVRIAARRARRHDRARFEVGDAHALPLPDATIDVAWTVEFFHHWPEPRADALAEIARVLVPAGRLLRRRAGHGLTAPGVDELIRRLQQAGFGEVTRHDLRWRLTRFVVLEAVA